MQISTFSTVSVVVLKNDEQIRDTRCRRAKEKGKAATLPFKMLSNQKVYSTPPPIKSRTPSTISRTPSLNSSSASIAFTIAELHS
jgi:hypothetical protein